MEKEFYIYQNRPVKDPWAFKIILDVENTRRPAMLFTITLLHSSLPESGRSVYLLHPEHLSDFSGIAWNMCRKEGIGFNDNDAMQFDSAILDIISSTF